MWVYDYLIPCAMSMKRTNPEARNCWNAILFCSTFHFTQFLGISPFLCWSNPKKECLPWILWCFNTSQLPILFLFWHTAVINYLSTILARSTRRKMLTCSTTSEQIDILSKNLFFLYFCIHGTQFNDIFKCSEKMKIKSVAMGVYEHWTCENDVGRKFLVYWRSAPTFSLATFFCSTAVLFRRIVYNEYGKHKANLYISCLFFCANKIQCRNSMSRANTQFLEICHTHTHCQKKEDTKIGANCFLQFNLVSLFFGQR